jgi:hypothetical protein
MAYGSNENALKEVAPLGIAIHQDVSLVEIKAFTTEPNGQGKTYDVMDFKFENPVGKSHTIRQFDPAGSTPDKVGKNETKVSNFVAYIATKVKGVDTPFNGKGVTSWEDFTKKSIELIGETSEVKFQLKLNGNVYNNRASVVVSNFGGWLERQESKLRLEYTPNERKGNLEYEAYYSSAVSSGAGSNIGDAPKSDLPF